MFILLISRGVPTKRDPQWGCFERDQANALRALGHKVVVVSVDTRFRLFYRKFGIKRTNLDGIDYFDCFIYFLNRCATCRKKRVRPSAS